MHWNVSFDASCNDCLLPGNKRRTYEREANKNASENHGASRHVYVEYN